MIIMRMYCESILIMNFLFSFFSGLFFLREITKYLKAGDITLKNVSELCIHNMQFGWWLLGFECCNFFFLIPNILWQGICLKDYRIIGYILTLYLVCVLLCKPCLYLRFCHKINKFFRKTFWVPSISKLNSSSV